MRRYWRKHCFGRPNLLGHPLEERAPRGWIAEPFQVIDECEETLEVNSRFVEVAQ